MTNLPEQLKQARITAGLSPKQLADTLGIDRTNIYHYESGKPPYDGMSSKLIQKWADACKCEIVFKPQEK